MAVIMGQKCEEITDAPGVAAREILFREIEHLSVSIGKLESKLAPVSYFRAVETTGPSECCTANSEYFASIFDAAYKVKRIKEAVDYLYESVEL